MPDFSKYHFTQGQARVVFLFTCPGISKEI